MATYRVVQVDQVVLYQGEQWGWVVEISHDDGQKTVSGALPPLGVFRDSRRLLRRPVPGHQFVDAFLRPTVHEACQQFGEIGLRIDAVEFTGFDQRR